MVDIFNTTFSDDYKPLYRNEGDANLTDISYQMGIADISVPFLGWGDAFFDYDNDGWKDLIMANGHVYPQVDQQPWGTSWTQRPLLFHNIGGKKFEPVPAVEGTGLADVIAGRGLAVGDLFNDGKLDVVINVEDGHPVLLRNVIAGQESLAGTEACRRRQNEQSWEPARRRGRNGVCYGQRHEAAGRRGERRQLRLDQRSPAALRPWPGDKS